MDGRRQQLALLDDTRAQLLPYSFFLALEEPNERALFRARRNMLKYRFRARD